MNTLSTCVILGNINWNSLFSSEIFTVQYEDLVMNQEVVSRRLIKYLDLEWDERCLDFHENKRVVGNISSMAVRQPIYTGSIGRWKHYEKQLAPLIAQLNA